MGECLPFSKSLLLSFSLSLSLCLSLYFSSCWANMSAWIIELLNEPVGRSHSVLWTPRWPRLWAPVWCSDEVLNKAGGRGPGQAKHLMEVQPCIIAQFWSYPSCTSRRWLYQATLVMTKAWRQHRRSSVYGQAVRRQRLMLCISKQCRIDEGSGTKILPPPSIA